LVRLREAVKAAPNQDFFNEVIIYDLSKRNANLTKSLSFQLILTLLAGLASIPQLWTNATAFKPPNLVSGQSFSQPIIPREKPDQDIENELPGEQNVTQSQNY
jgi:hypothetical protein